MIDRAPNKHLQDFDFIILAVVLALSLISICMVASASRVNLTGNASYFYIRQTVWYLLGFLLLFGSLRFDYTEIGKHAKWLYLLGIGTLLLVQIMGSVTNGAQSWLQLGPFRFEPAELMKIILILTLAQLLREETTAFTFTNWMRVLLCAALPIGLVILQPDLGTALMMSSIAVGMIFAAGVPTCYLLSMAAAACSGAAGMAWLYHARQDLFFTLIKPYQWQRLTMFLNPEPVLNDAGYQLYQSLLAIGTGRLLGQGVFQGMQTQGAWIPERHTDFIFSVIAEELGFLGAGFLLVSYFILLNQIIKIGREARDQMGSLIAAGVLSMFLAQIFENVGMTMSMMPITGITLPLVSYGGSSILSTMLAIGLVLNVGYRRKTIRF